MAAVDLNIIPDAMVDHYEILKDGASSIYGSDAVGGVVNIITKNKYDGLTLESDNDVTQRGHGNDYELSATWGHIADHYHVTGSIQYYKQEPLTIGDLPGGKCPSEKQAAPTVQGYNYNRSYADGSPYCNFEQVDFVSVSGSGGGLFVFSPLAPANKPYIPFSQGSYPAFPRVTNIATDPNEANVDASSPFHRFGATLIGGVDLPGGAEFYFEDLITDRRSQQQAFLPQFFPAQAATKTLVSVNQFNPFPGHTVQPVIGAPITQQTQNVWAGHAVFGVKGDFGSMLSGWRYDAYVTYGFARADYSTQAAARRQDQQRPARWCGRRPGTPPSNLVRTNPVDGLNYTCSVNIGNPNEGCYTAEPGSRPTSAVRIRTRR